jgi:5-methyltetrahydropteroyltriglutamate--homocysteine methyltransferase
VFVHGEPERVPTSSGVNPECGLKTRAWPEVAEVLKGMAAVAKGARQRLAVA